MRYLRILYLRLRSLVRRSAVDADARREMELHLELLTQEKVLEGMPLATARLAARREMGNMGLLAEQSRDARGVNYLHDFIDDLVFAARLLRKSPVFTAVSILSLGLGIGANTAIFTLIKRSYLDLLPVRDPDQMVRLTRATNLPTESASFTYELYREMAAANTPFDGLLATSTGRVSVAREGGVADSLSVLLVSGNYFQLLGVQPLLGRLLTPDDDRNPGGHPLVVLSHNYWRGRLAADPGVIGKTIRLNTTPMTVIGVSPPGFEGLNQGWSPDVMVPLMMQAQVYQSRSWLQDRGHWWLHVAGRLKPGFSAQQGELALQPVLAGYYELIGREPGTSDYVRGLYSSYRVRVRPVSTGWHRNPAAATNAMVLLGITALVLLAACANLANLLLARAAARRGEMAVRLAIGAGRFRLVRQLLTESSLLAFLGGGLGLALAFAAGPLVVRLAAGDDPQVTQNVTPDLTILAYSFGIATFCGLLFGLAPAWQAVRGDGNPGFDATRTIAGSRHWGRKLLLSGHIALTLLLLAAASLFVRSVRNMETADLGFSPERLLQFTLLPRNAGYADAQVMAYLDRAIERIRQLPGVVSVTSSAMLVMADSSWGTGVRIEGVTIPENVRGPDRNAVGASYFGTMGIPLVRGRDFNERDREGAPMVAVVNESFAKHYFGTQDPIGRRMDQGGDPSAPLRYTIIGVAKDGKYRGVRDSPTRFWYVPIAQSTMRNYLTLYVRTSGDTAGVAAGVRPALASVDANVAAMNLRTVESQIAALQRFERMIALFAAILGALAVVLAAIGLYGVLAFLVEQRRREIGIRLALGATQASVATLVVRSVAGWAVLGIVLAMPAIYYGSNAVQDVLYEVRPMDPASLLWAGGILAGAAMVAAWMPARRAASVQPSTAMRSE